MSERERVIAVNVETFEEGHEDFQIDAFVCQDRWIGTGIQTDLGVVRHCSIGSVLRNGSDLSSITPFRFDIAAGGISGSCFDQRDFDVLKFSIVSTGKGWRFITTSGSWFGQCNGLSNGSTALGERKAEDERKSLHVCSSSKCL